jgi:hypothetical protein
VRAGGPNKDTVDRGGQHPLVTADVEAFCFITAVVDRASIARHLADIAWETEVSIADAPTHIVHFNGDRVIGPH